MARSGGRIFGAVVAASAVLAALGYWAWTEHKSRALRNNVISIVRDTSARLGDALQSAPSGNAAANPKLEEDARAIDRQIDELRRMSARRDRPLAYAAEGYAMNARQLLRDLALSQRQGERVAQNMKRLFDHMNNANRRANGWYDRALQLKAELEKSYFDYRLAADALGQEFESYPKTYAKLAAQVDASLLFDEAAAAAARERFLQAAKRTDDDMARARKLATR